MDWENKKALVLGPGARAILLTSRVNGYPQAFVRNTGGTVFVHHESVEHPTYVNRPTGSSTDLAVVPPYKENSFEEYLGCERLEHLDMVAVWHEKRNEWIILQYFLKEYETLERIEQQGLPHLVYSMSSLPYSPD